MALPSWLHFSQLSGSGDTVITVTADTYDKFYDRSDNFIVSGNTLWVRVYADQERIKLDTPLTFNITSNGNLRWKKSASGATTCVIQYSKNGGEWTNLTPTTAGVTINVSAGDVVQFRGDNAAYAGSSHYCSFSGSTASFTLAGNIMSLINSTSFDDIVSFSADYVFRMLFNHTNVTDASNLALPIEYMSMGCYESMFNYCQQLTKPPVLPAPNLYANCYYGMFAYCTALTEAPDLPALTVYDFSYSGMFRNCTSLVNPPTMAMTTISGNSCMYMFENCTSLVSSPHLLPETLYAYGVTGCYAGMFAGCTALTTIWCNAVTRPANSTSGWVTNAGNGSGTFYKNANATWTVDPDDGVPTGWSVVDIA